MSEDKGRTFALKLKGVPVGFLGICLSGFIVSKDGINWQYRVRTAGFCGVTEVYDPAGDLILKFDEMCDIAGSRSAMGGGAGRTRGRCTSCRWWRRMENPAHEPVLIDGGDCRRHAPIAVDRKERPGRPYILTTFPQTDENDRCGDFERREGY